MFTKKKKHRGKISLSKRFFNKTYFDVIFFFEIDNKQIDYLPLMANNSVITGTYLEQP